jgi:hypothetical protein
LGSVELRIDSAVEAEVNHEAVAARVTWMTSRAAVPWTVTVPLDKVAVGPVAAPAGAAATKPPAAVAITATIPASRRGYELVCMVLLLCECWYCYYASAAELVRAVGSPVLSRDRPEHDVKAAAGRRSLDGAERSDSARTPSTPPRCQDVLTA